MMKPKQTEKLDSKEMISALSVLLGSAMAASVAAFFLHRMISDRAYHRRWSDYDDCGVA